jgi:cytochrome c553
MKMMLRSSLKVMSRILPRGGRYHVGSPVCQGQRKTLTAISFLVVAVVISGCSPDPSVAPPLPITDQAVRRGEQLVNGLGACGFCHSGSGAPGALLSGGRQLHDAYGEIQSPNITVAQGAGIGNWSESDLKLFMRTSVRPDQTQAQSSFHKGFEWLSDLDINRIASYLASLPAAEAPVERREVSFLTRNSVGFFDSRPAVRGYIPEISQSFRREYGQYLVDHVARCGSCHSTPGGVFTSDVYLAGGAEFRVGEEGRIAPNITSSDIVGIGGWSESDLKEFFRTGKRPNGNTVDARFCPVGFYSQAPEGDIEAVVDYLRSLPVAE